MVARSRVDVVQPLDGANAIVLVTAMLITAAWSGIFPIIGAFVGLTICAGITKNERLRTVFLAGSVILMAGLLNALKHISGDWAWYSEHYSWLWRVGFFDYLGHRVGPFNIKNTEPVYHFISWATSNLTRGNLPTLAVVVTALIYIPATIAITRITRVLAAYPFQRLAADWIVLLTGITFTLTLHLVRQEIAGAFIICSVVLFFYDRKWLSLLFAVLAVLTHNSAVFPLAIMVFGWLLSRYLPSSFILGGIIALVAGLASGFGMLLLGRILNSFPEGKSDGEIGWLVISMDAFLIFCFSIAQRKLKFMDRQQVAAIGLILICYFAFLVGLRAEPLPFLRMYFFVDYARILLVATLTTYVLGGSKGLLYSGVLLFAAIAYFSLRALRSPFWFGGGIIRVILTPIWQLF
jgi:hypothetical protein